jgi:hypothetical protein
MSSDIQIFDNIIPKTYQDEIERVMTSYEFHWAYRRNVSSQPGDPLVYVNDPNIEIRDAFIHLFYADKENITSSHASLIRPILYFLEERAGIKIEHVIRIRAVLTYRDPNWNEDHYLTPHVDDISPDHTHTFIYYVNDCDGDTFFYKDFYTTADNYNKRTLEQSFTPRKGVGVLFNGKRYHGNGVGRKENRIVINMNLTVKENV